jgi:anti-sigma B factor antagonist
MKIASVKVLPLAGEFDIAGKDELWRKLASVSDADVAILDLSRLKYLDSTALTCFVILRKHMSEHGGTVALASPRRQILKLLRTCAFDQVFPIYKSVAEARSAWAGEEPPPRTSKGDLVT